MKKYYRRFKKNSPLRQYATPTIVRNIKKLENHVGNIERYFIRVQHKTKFRAICHFGMQKTGSVWFREMLSDVKLYRYSGLPFVDCAGQTVNFGIDRGIYAPIRTVTAETLSLLTRPDVAKIIVIRDPIALLISWVNSTENYHVAGGQDNGMLERRETLRNLNFHDKILFALHHFNSQKRFQKTVDLIRCAEDAPFAEIIRYEDCLNRPKETFKKLFQTIDVPIPDDELDEFLTEHSFASYAGRKLGSASPAYSALQGNTLAAVAGLSPELKSKIIYEVPSELRAYYENSKI